MKSVLYQVIKSKEKHFLKDYEKCLGILDYTNYC